MNYSITDRQHRTAAHVLQLTLNIYFSFPKLNVHHTVNVDIFACINFRGFMKMGNFTWIEIRVFSTKDSLGYYDSNFYSVYIFADI